MERNSLCCCFTVNLKHRTYVQPIDSKFRGSCSSSGPYARSKASDNSVLNKRFDVYLSLHFSTQSVQTQYRVSLIFPKTRHCRLSRSSHFPRFEIRFRSFEISRKRRKLRCPTSARFWAGVRCACKKEKNCVSGEFRRRFRWNSCTLDASSFKGLIYPAKRKTARVFSVSVATIERTSSLVYHRAYACRACSASSHPLTLHSLKRIAHSKYWPVYPSAPPGIGAMEQLRISPINRSILVD